MAFHRPADYEDYNFLKCRFEEIGSKDQYKLRYLVRRVAESEGVEKIVFVDVKSMADYLAKFYIDNVVVGLDSKNKSEKAAGSGFGRDNRRKMEPIIDFGFECEAEVKRDPILDFGFEDIYKEKENSLVGFDDFSDRRIKPILDLGRDLNEGLNDVDKISDEFLFFKFLDDYSLGYSNLSAFDCGELSFLKGRELESTIAWLVIRNFRGGYLYDSLNLPLDLDDHRRMYFSILEFFMFLDVGSNIKMELLQNVKDACNRVNDEKDPLNGLMLIMIILFLGSGGI
ncbi:hypothetical protein MBH78_00440 [Oceanimonas sp. NS1]|nr:hypothetical protein [Oceanimonas sp. NS1]